MRPKLRFIMPTEFQTDASHRPMPPQTNADQIDNGRVLFLC